MNFFFTNSMFNFMKFSMKFSIMFALFVFPLIGISQTSPYNLNPIHEYQLPSVNSLTGSDNVRVISGTSTRIMTLQNFANSVAPFLTGSAHELSIDWSNVLSTPTTLAGYGITDALPLTGGVISGPLSTGHSILDDGYGSMTIGGGFFEQGNFFYILNARIEAYDENDSTVDATVQVLDTADSGSGYLKINPRLLIGTYGTTSIQMDGLAGTILVGTGTNAMSISSSEIGIPPNGAIFFNDDKFYIYEDGDTYMGIQHIGGLSNQNWIDNTDPYAQGHPEFPLGFSWAGGQAYADSSGDLSPLNILMTGGPVGISFGYYDRPNFPQGLSVSNGSLAGGMDNTGILRDGSWHTVFDLNARNLYDEYNDIALTSRNGDDASVFFQLEPDNGYATFHWGILQGISGGTQTWGINTSDGSIYGNSIKDVTGSTIYIDLTNPFGLGIPYIPQGLTTPYIGSPNGQFIDLTDPTSFGLMAFVNGGFVMCGNGGPSFTVGSLPSPSSIPVGTVIVVSDANSPSYNSIAVGGGSSVIPVMSDGTNWRCR